MLCSLDTLRLCFALWTVNFEVMLCCSRARHKGPEPAPGGAAGHRRAARVPRGGVPQHHQLLDQEPWRDAAGRVS